MTTSEVRAIGTHHLTERFSLTTEHAGSHPFLVAQYVTSMGYLPFLASARRRGETSGVKQERCTECQEIMVDPTMYYENQRK